MSTWVIGDIHGCKKTFMALLNNKEIKEDDTIILIGDIIDRGPDSVEMLKWAMENITENGRFQMVCGNHEDNIICDYDDVLTSAMLYNNSGLGNGHINIDDSDIGVLSCHYVFDVYMQEAGYETVGSVKHIIEWMRSLPLKKEVTVTTPDGTEQKYIIVHAWWHKDASRKYALWERDISDFGRLTEDYYPEDNEILIHGHTPVLKAHGYPENAVVFFRDHSINVDAGCFVKDMGGRLAALRLEDKHVIYQENIDM